MNLTKKNVLLITLNSIGLAGGILMIFIPAIIVHNYWPFLSIFIFAVSLIFPALCNAMNITSESSASDAWLFDSGNDAELGGTLSWLATGVCLVIGYGIPFELWRTNSMNTMQMWMTFGGGSVIMASISLFAILILQIGKQDNALF
jgi:hypothetical protein